MTTPPAPPKTMAIVGCGTMGTAILCGVLDALSSDSSEPVPELVPRRFAALVTSAPSVARIRESLTPFGLAARDAVTVDSAAHAAAVMPASMVLLACKPYLAASILSMPDMRAALEDKLLVSVCAGTTLGQLEALVPATCRVVRVMPNTAARLRKSMTAISASRRVLPQELAAVRWICASIGRTVVLDEKHMDAATAICGSGPAFAAMLLEAMTDGGVLVGVPRPQAQTMVAQGLPCPPPFRSCPSCKRRLTWWQQCWARLQWCSRARAPT